MRSALTAAFDSQTSNRPQLTRLNKTIGALARRVTASPELFKPRPVLMKAQPRPLLLHQAGGGAWLGCQSRIYGNVLRGIALLQIALLVPAHELDKRGHTSASVPLLAILALDALLFCVSGPTPWTLSGNLATLLVWPRRGTVAPIGPYKVTVGGLYLLMNVAGLACRLSAPSEADGGLLVGGNSSASTPVAAGSPAPFCDLINSDVWSGRW